MSDKAKINIIGHLTQKPVPRMNNKTGKQYVTFSVAINYYDNQWKKTETMYMNCVAGERHLSYLQEADKGDKIAAEGKLTPTSYVDKDGVKHEVYTI